MWILAVLAFGIAAFLALAGINGITLTEVVGIVAVGLVFLGFEIGGWPVRGWPRR